MISCSIENRCFSRRRGSLFKGKGNLPYQVMISPRLKPFVDGNCMWLLPICKSEENCSTSLRRLEDPILSDPWWRAMPLYHARFLRKMHIAILGNSCIREEEYQHKSNMKRMPSSKIAIEWQLILVGNKKSHPSFISLKDYDIIPMMTSLSAVDTTKLSAYDCVAH